MARLGFRLVRFRSPLLTESRFLSLPEGTEMFQFPSLALPVLCIQTGVGGHDPTWVSPFGNPWFCGWLTPHQGLSQPPTSFFASRCLGIHRVHFSTCRRDARARYGVLKQRVTSAVPEPVGSNATDGPLALCGCDSQKGTPPLQSCTACPFDCGVHGEVVTCCASAARLPPTVVPRTS